MSFRTLGVPALVLLLVLPSVGCSGVNDPSKNKNDDITDTIDVGLAQIYSFDATKNGEFTVTITALSNPNVVLGINVGLLDVFGNCSPVLGQNTLSVLNRTAVSGSLNKGTYCMEVFDNGGGTLTGPTTFTVRLSHP